MANNKKAMVELSHDELVMFGAFLVVQQCGVAQDGVALMEAAMQAAIATQTVEATDKNFDGLMVRLRQAHSSICDGTFAEPYRRPAELDDKDRH